MGGAVGPIRTGVRGKITFVYHCRTFPYQGTVGLPLQQHGRGSAPRRRRPQNAGGGIHRDGDRPAPLRIPQAACGTAAGRPCRRRRPAPAADRGPRPADRPGAQAAPRRLPRAARRDARMPSSTSSRRSGTGSRLSYKHQDKPETDATAMDDAKVEEAARVLRDLREAFTDATPEEVRDLLTPLVSKIELHFEHVQNGKKPAAYIPVRDDPRPSYRSGLSLLFATPQRNRT